MAKILFYAHDPGGANAIAPVAMSLSERGWEVVCRANGPALKILPNVLEAGDDDADRLFDSVRPDFVVTGTSAADMVEKRLRVVSRAKGVRSMSVLDHWVNYGIRFSRYSTAERSAYEKDRRFEYLPDFIVVMDDFAKQEMVNEGISPEIIWPLGNPHFDILRDRYAEIEAADIRNRLLVGRQKLVVFASEPYTEDYGQGDEVRAIMEIASVLPKDFSLAVKPHPRERLEKFAGLGISIVEPAVSSLEAIKAADVVLSMTSMVLIEALICGRAAVSYRPGAADGRDFMLTRRELIPFVSQPSGMEAVFFDMIRAPEVSLPLLISGATSRICDFIEEQLRKCQN